VDDLPTEEMRAALRHELCLGTVGFCKPASDEEVAAFQRAFPQLAREWSGRAPRKLGAVYARLDRMFESLGSDLERDAARSKLDDLSEAQLAAFFRALAG
jgi:hypothetical protein